MNHAEEDLKTVRDYVGSVTGFSFPVYKTEEGSPELWDVVMVSSYAQVPDGRWTASHGPFWCLANSPGDWVAYSPAGEGFAEADAFDKDTIFYSLTKAIEAARAEQRKMQADIDKEGKS